MRSPRNLRSAPVSTARRYLSVGCRAMEIYLVRHGETEWAASGKHTSVTDVPLLESGRRDAELLRERLAGRSFALVLTSPRARARETCELAGLGDGAVVASDLGAVDQGATEGRTTRRTR